MLLDDAVGHGQAQTGALAHRLGGEEGIEDARLDGLRDAVAAVAHLDAHQAPIPVHTGAQQQFAAALGLHGVVGVVDQVDDHLAQLFRVADDERQVRGQVQAQLDVAQVEIVLRDRGRILDDLVAVHRLAGAARLARVLEQVGDDLAAGLGLPLDHLQILVGLGIPLEVVHHQLGVAEDDAQRGVDLVGDAGGHLADGGHFLAGDELLHHGLQSGQVLGDALGADDVAVVVVEGGGRDEHVDGGVVLLDELRLQVADKAVAGKQGDKGVDLALVAEDVAQVEADGLDVRIAEHLVARAVHVHDVLAVVGEEHHVLGGGEQVAELLLRRGQLAGALLDLFLQVEVQFLEFPGRLGKPHLGLLELGRLLLDGLVGLHALVVEDHHRGHRDHEQGVEPARVGADRLPDVTAAGDLQEFPADVAHGPAGGKGGDGQVDVEQVAPEEVVGPEPGEAEGVPGGEERKHDVERRSGHIHEDGRQQGQAVHRVPLECAFATE